MFVSSTRGSRIKKPSTKKSRIKNPLIKKLWDNKAVDKKDMN